MSFKGLLKLDDVTYRILDWRIHITQQMDQSGKPNADPAGGLIKLTVESTGSTDFIDWAVSQDMTKNGSIIFEESNKEGSSLKTFEFYNGYCVDYIEDFSSQGTSPMVVHVTISAYKLKCGSNELTKNWDKI